MNKEIFEELEQVSKPMIEFLRKYYCPHDIAIIQEGSVKIFEGSMSKPLEIQD